ncbi:MAG: hypothetical protein A2Z83_07800 [Omnitrophica bacterium GWA2_52_8]|nr:MAG: hypothetical protein A2Z83_07800 [Omnitrophica bacterium GWA2_52_8]
MMKESILKDDLFFHYVHGLCRVGEVTGAGSAGISYLLLPVTNTKANERFIVPAMSFEDSGFSKPVTVRGAYAILDFIKTGDKKESECGRAWELAALVRTEGKSREPAKDARKRQHLERTVKGLVFELAFVLKTSAGDITARMRKNLGAAAEINPFVLTALTNAGKD